MSIPAPKTNQSERALKVLIIALACGLVAIVAYAIDAKTWGYFLTSCSIGIIVAVAALLVGGLLGFLFGIPRASQSLAAEPAAETSADPQGESLAGGRLYRPNTNLEQI